jgi:hypothetical protein
LSEILVSEQEQKYHLSLAGEFFVAGELQRRRVSAAVTYGNAKAADVVAFSRDGKRVVVIEVKSTSKDKWVVGGTVPRPSDQPWVFVKIPATQVDSPSFFVLKQSELHDLLAPDDEMYRSKYRAKHGVPFTGKGVVSLKESMILHFKDKWDSILKAIGA